MLKVGERQGDIEVLEIDEKMMSVKVSNAGVIETLTFDKNGAKLPPTSAPSAAPGAVPLPAGGIPTPALPGVPGMAPGLGKDALPSRTLRSQGGDAGGLSNPVGMGSASQGAGFPPNNAAALQAAAQRTPEETVALYEANRLKNEQLRAAGVRIPRLPAHVFLGGNQE
jgi:hypothetical protein